jgi:hypothetical protein
MDMSLEKINDVNLVIVGYPQYTGGKFLMNCLSMSRHAIPPDRDAYEHLIENQDDYEFRRKFALNTLPLENEMNKWLRFEANCSTFLSPTSSGNFINDITIILNDLLNGTAHIQTYEMLDSIRRKKLTIFSETPSYEFQNLIPYYKIFPKFKLIQFINFNKFYNIASKKKNINHNNLSAIDKFGNYCKEKYDILKGEAWPEWNKFECNYYNPRWLKKNQDIILEMEKFYVGWPDLSLNKLKQFNVDKLYFNKDNFLIKMKQLYTWLDFDDYNSELISEYYESYIALHSKI